MAERDMDQVWIDAVVASKEAAQRDRDLASRERDRYRETLEEIAKWKGSDAYGDLCARKARKALDG